MVAWIIILALAGCRSWEERRAEFIDPINQFLHQRYPRAWESLALENLLGFYSPELAASPAFRARKAEMLARFSIIERAGCIIEDLAQIQGEDQVQARLLLKLRGRSPEKKLFQMEQRSEVQCRRDHGVWRISQEALIKETRAYSDRPVFNEESEARGVVFKHASGGVLDKNGIVQNFSAGSGLAVGDFDDDGLDDLYLLGGVECRLFRNCGNGRFEDVTARAGVAARKLEARCAVFADYDNDGHNDLFVGVLDAPNPLFHNRGDGTFEEAAARAGLVPVNDTVGAAFADFNNDGNLDLYLVNGGNLYRNHPDPLYNALNATPNVLYISNGDGTFRDETARAGVGHTGWGLCVSTADYDLDGDIDIFVGNDVGYSVLYRNRGDGTFENVAREAGISYRGSAMSASWGDLNGDGLPDLFVAEMDSNSRWMIDQTGFPAPAPWYINLFLRPTVLSILKEMLYGNRSYLNNGDGTFRESAETMGVRKNGWAWSTHCFDYDNDGDLDLYSVNGFISGPVKKDL